ncbi:hypothetical protein DV735_g5552, partial [Chaetothyriales sp. CBS 134920]
MASYAASQYIRQQPGNAPAPAPFRVHYHGVCTHALLSRHECFVAKAREENERLSATIADLQSKREELQTANERIVAENRELVEQLDAINACYRSSDQAAKSLEQQLKCVELEIGQLTIRARRAEELEACVQDLHLERTTLKGKLEEAEVESRTVLARWRESERKIKQLESELDKIEWESKAQRQKHDEAVALLEHERVVDRALSGAEARLKGAAAVHEIEQGTSNTSVVSSFVRDILKDNATLQAGILELRELLQSSNDEVQNLRQQVMFHQPVEDTHPADQLPDLLPLDQQRGWSEPTPAAAMRQPEFHVHHHYHAKLTSKRDRTSGHSKTPRRRSALRSVVTPRTSLPSSPDLPLGHTQARRSRSSAYFSAAGESIMSSMPSTPRSAFDRYSSIFDRLDPSEESSRPTSPESAAGFLSSGPDSETWLDMKKRRLDYFDAVAESEDQAEMAVEDMEEGSLSVELSKLQTQRPEEESVDPSPTCLSPSQPSGGHALPEPRHPDKMETNDGVDGETATVSAGPSCYAGSSSEEADFRSQLPLRRPFLHHSGSHDSLVSISGMDIHIAKRPTASLLKGANSAHFPILPSSVRRISASQPVAGITDITATSWQQSFTSLAQGPADLHLQSIARVASIKEPSPQIKGTTSRSFARAQWLVPDSSEPDLATTWNDGDSVTLSWAALNSSICDLWLTDPNGDDYTIRLASNINLADAGTLPWSIDIGTEQLSIGQTFALSFIPTGQAYSSQQVHITSPTFTVLPKGSASPSHTTSSSSLLPSPSPTTTTTAAITSATHNSAAANSTNPDNGVDESNNTSNNDDDNDDSHSGLSTRVKVGAGIAIVVVLTLIIGLLFWVLHLRRRTDTAWAA